MKLRHIIVIPWLSYQAKYIAAFGKRNRGMCLLSTFRCLILLMFEGDKSIFIVFRMKIPWSSHKCIFKTSKECRLILATSKNSNDDKFSSYLLFSQKIPTSRHHFSKKYIYNVMEIMFFSFFRYRIQIQWGPAEKRHQRQPSR